jgi:hypothetical protein
MGPGWMIQTVDSKPVPDLDSFIKVIQGLQDGKRVPMTYCSVADIHTILVKIVEVELTWNSFSLTVRNDSTGLWDKTNLIDQKIGKHVYTPCTAKFATLDESLGPCKSLLKSIVTIDSYLPLRLDSTPRGKKYDS